MNGPSCEFCGEIHREMYLHARCHLNAPLDVSLDGNLLVVRCYIPSCKREVARFEVVRQIPTGKTDA